MSISKIPPAPVEISQAPGIDDFRREAALGETLHVHIDGESYALIAKGKTPSGRSVAWLDGGDATRMFVSAMESSFGGRLSKIISDELELQPIPGKPLSSRTVERALGMAETASCALDGVNFAAQVAHTDGSEGNASTSAAQTEFTAAMSNAAENGCKP